MHGYTGKTLVLELNGKKVIERETGIEDCFQYIGGLGINTKIMMEELDPSIDPLSESNVLCFGAGPLTGTLVPTANRTDVAAKSPLTGLLGTSNSGYRWGPELKYCGYDHLVIKGRAESPAYIFIDNGEVNILDASHLWGKDSWDTIRDIRSAHEDDGIPIACIGVGGEKLVKFASIENGFYGAWGRTGLGAVMGSKNLKAVALRGRKDVTISDGDGFVKSVDEMRDAIMNHPAYKPWRALGSMLAVDITYGLGAVTTYNQSEAAAEDFIRSMGKDNLLNYKKKSIGCMACPIACANWVEIEEGPYRGLKLKGIEITSVMDFGARCGVRNLAAIAKATELFQKYGIDCSTSAASIALAIELFAEGIISTADTDGLELKWGDEPLIFELLRKIAYREGFGDLLADGPLLMAKRIGKGSEQYLVQSRGLETNVRDPRGRWDVWSFGYLLNPRGGDHLRVQSPGENQRESAPEGEYFYECSPPDKVVDRLDIFDEWKEKIFDRERQTVSIPHMAAWSQDIMNIVDSLATCMRPPALWSLGPTIFSRLLTTATGIEFSAEDVRKAGERITTLQRIFNFKAGETRQDLKYGPKFYNMPIRGRKLDPGKVDKVLDKYFEARGWDPKTAMPSEKKLEELNLHRFVR